MHTVMSHQLPTEILCKIISKIPSPGNVDSVFKAYQLAKTIKDKYTCRTILSNNMDLIVAHAFATGRVEALELLDQYNIELYFAKLDVYMALRRGHVDVLKWLDAKYPAEIAALINDPNQAFELSARGSLDVLKWWFGRFDIGDTATIFDL
ncbi:hypothetical protein GGF32_002405, partial [Allomyces javanicus]